VSNKYRNQLGAVNYQEDIIQLRSEFETARMALRS